ncbi:MAG: methyltransferase protein [Actinomycetia bacterium]|nr:methyltransferase protein [Actinomycetes bacterium]
MELLPRELLVKTNDLDQAEWNYKPVLGYIERRRYQLLVKLLGTEHFADALEVGYGSGVFLPELARHASAVSGVDPHDRAQDVNVALEKVGVTATLYSAPGEQLPMADASYDLIVVVSALEFVTDIDKVCSEMRRVLTTDGTLVVITPGQSKLIDLGLRVLSGEKAEDTFSGGRAKVIPTLRRYFTDVEIAEFPPLAPRSLRLYTALKMKPRHDEAPPAG